MNCLQNQLKSNKINSLGKILIKKNVLIGSSHVGQINVTLVNEEIKDYNETIVYNLAIIHDTPKDRLKTITSVIAMKPDLVLYGISVRDVLVNKPTNTILPDPKKVLHGLVPDAIKEQIPTNPKFTTLQIIRDFLNKANYAAYDKPVTIPNTPFYDYIKVLRKISTDKELKEQANIDLSNVIVDISKEGDLDSFQTIIGELTKNNIKVIIFEPPLHDYYLNRVSNENKEKFDSIVRDISTEYNLKYYNFSTYSDLPIWSDISHVSFNKNSTVYSKDIAGIIMREIQCYLTQ